MSRPIAVHEQARASRAESAERQRRELSELRAAARDAETRGRRLETPPERDVRVLAQISSKLLTLDRYERRALSRQKSAVRQFDLAPEHVG